LLDERGEPHVTDFGLAKRVDGDSDLTQSGAILGTPPYMAPEQASGKRGMVTTATDVYGLGAILYAILAGRAPFSGDSPLDILEQVRERIPDAPSKHNPRIPRDLEVICLKCLEKQPERRYASAQALAEDLNRYLNNEAILARPVGLATRALMWCTRNPALARLGFALLLALLLGGFAAVVIDGARRSETVARLDAEKSLTAAKEAKRLEEIARQEAETNFDMAKQVVDDYFTNVSENTLLKEQDTLDIRTLRQGLLRTALRYYEEFAKARENDPRLRRQLAKAYYRVGQINGEIDSHSKAIDALRASRAIWSPLYESGRRDFDAGENLSECYLAIGKLQLLDHSFSAAESSLGQSRAILERLQEQNPSEPRYQARLASCYSEIGTVLAKLDRLDQSLDIYEKARAIQVHLVKQFPDKLSYRKSLAENITAIGFAHSRRPDNIAAINAYLEVRDICETTMKELPAGPKPVWLLSLLAISQYNIGVIHKKNREIESALKFFEQSLASQSDLVDSHRSVTRFQEKLAATSCEIADLRHMAHEDSKALLCIRKSIDVLSGLVRMHPEQASLHNSLAYYWNYLGWLHDEARNNADAIGPFRNAMREQQLAIDEAEDGEIYKSQLCEYLDNLGEQYVDRGNVAEGLKWHQQALETRRALNEAHPENRKYAMERVNALIKLGSIRRHEPDPLAARQLFTEAKQIVDKWLATANADEGFKALQARVLDDEAKTMADENHLEKAKSVLDEATALFRQLAGDGVVEREWHSEALWDLTRVLRALELTADADRVEAERTDLWKVRPPEELVGLAFKHASRANLIGYGKTPVSAQAKAVRELDLDQAADEVRMAITRGFKDLRMLKSHPDAGAVLSREDLAAALEDLAFPRNPFGGRR
jgi:eukaryotic-like serine/threonine-protein kinase